MNRIFQESASANNGELTVEASQRQPSLNLDCSFQMAWTRLRKRRKQACAKRELWRGFRAAN